MRNSSAYTLIELLVGISIISLIFSFGFSSYRDFSRKEALTGLSKKIASDLRLIQQKALSGEKPAGCNVLLGYQFNIISENSYNLEAVCTNSIIPESVSLGDSSVVISSTANPIYFKVIGQGTNLTSTATITLTNNLIGKSEEIIVGSGGDIK